MAEFVAPVPVGYRLGKTPQPGFGFPLLPPDRVCTNDEVIGRIPHAQVTTLLGLVIEFDRRRLEAIRLLGQEVIPQLRR